MQRVLPLLALIALSAVHIHAAKPNIIFVLADDLGYGDLGCFGQKHIKTPNLDRMAKEGMRLTSFYAGSTVCAPSRSVLMTGQHTGRTWVRGNAGKDNRDAQTLRPQDVTVAEVLKKAGYATALCGKWGLGELDSTGHPNQQGFDYFYGYLNQRHAHNFFPTFLVKNHYTVKLRNVPHPEWVKLAKEKNYPDDGAGFAIKKVDYAHDLIVDEGLGWIDENVKKPFFLYLALNVPHANNEAGRSLGDGQEVPEHGIYDNRDWPNPDKGQAAMITRMDRDMGRLMTKLREHGIEKNTLIIFTSDNGHHKEGGNNPDFFDANGPLRGMKRNLTEGGIRVPTIAWWPGTIAAGSISHHAAYFGDFMATAAELAGTKKPKNTQSISFVPTLTGKKQAQHDYLYWEFYERAGKQAVRFGNWKAIRTPMHHGEVQLYDLQNDLGELFDMADQRPDLVAQAKRYLDQAHVPNPNWVNRAPKKRKK
ncbi:MAG: arylsulfatase [Limisphaerales bacterium]